MDKGISVQETTVEHGKNDSVKKEEKGPLPAEQGAPLHNQDEKGGVENNDQDVEKRKEVVSKENALVNLSESELNHPKQKLELRHKKMFYSDSNLMNDALVGKQVESFKIKLKEHQSSTSWAQLTTANLQTLTKAQEPTSRQHSFQRIRKWVQDAAPPYDVNPSPGLSSLVSAPPAQPRCWMLRLFGCFQ